MGQIHVISHVNLCKFTHEKENSLVHIINMSFLIIHTEIVNIWKCKIGQTWTIFGMVNSKFQLTSIDFDVILRVLIIISNSKEFWNIVPNVVIFRLIFSVNPYNEIFWKNLNFSFVQLWPLPARPTVRRHLEQTGRERSAANMTVSGFSFDLTLNFTRFVWF